MKLRTVKKNIPQFSKDSKDLLKSTIESKLQMSLRVSTIKAYVTRLQRQSVLERGRLWI
jgi:hypothetical protein